MKDEIDKSMDGDQETLLSNSMSRKRPLESASPDPGDDESLPKKSNLSESEDGVINIKVMLPSQVTGAIIGKGGEAIGKVQSDTGCRVKMTKSNDFFPGTTERVAWINGPINAVLKVMAYFCEKSTSKTDASIKGDIFDYKQTERSKEIKLVIPSSSAGMVIGKGGEYIKSIKETTGAFAQMSGKDLVDVRLQERVVTIVGQNPGDPSDMLNAVRMVLNKVSTDVNSAKAPYTNLSYVHLTASKLAATLSTLAAAAGRPNSPRSVASSLLYQTTHQPSFSTGRHSPAPSNGMSLNGSNAPSLFGNYFQQQNSQQQQQPAPLFPPPTSSSSSAAAASAAATSNFGLGGSTLSNAGNLQILQFLDGLRSTLRSNGYGETAIVEIVQAMQTLAKYNVLGLGLGLGLAAMSKSAPQQEPDYPVLNPLAFGHKESSSFSNGGSNKYVASFSGFESSNSADRTLSSDFYVGQSDARREISAVIQQLTASRGESSPERHRDLPSLGYVSRSNLHGGGSDQSPRGDNDRLSIGDRLSLIKEYRLDGDKLELSVPDSLVGAILGRQARNLMEIQRYSGAKVEVSKREPNSTSTTERIISIEGQPEEIKAARRKIESVIIEEQYKRDSLRKY